MTTDLLATCWTHSGNSFPYQGRDTSDLDLLDRAEAAADAGFVGYGIFGPDLRVALQKHGIGTIRRRLRSLGLIYIELEFLTDWWCTGEKKAVADAERDFLLHAAEALGAGHVKVGAHINKMDDGAPLPILDIATMGSALHNLGELAARHNTKLALEFLPMSDVANVSDAVRLVEAADHPAVGLCVDVWHFERGTSDLSEIVAIPGEKIFAVELSDAPSQCVGGLYEDTIHHRVMPGRGAFELTGFISAVRSTGFPGPWGVEILSSEERKRPICDVLSDSFRTATASLNVDVMNQH